MSILLAVQSAIFYAVSCSPCIQARHHQKSKKRAKKEREEKARIQAEYPGAYQHPDPFSTNPYWEEEISMGPHIEAKKYYGGGTKNTSQKGLEKTEKDAPKTPGNVAGPNSMDPGSRPTVVGEDAKLSFSATLSTAVSDDWNRKRYQREDEELWGHELSRTGHRLMDAIKHAGSSAGRLLEASLGKEPKAVSDEDRQSFYFAPRNPPVNDYHPPIVRQRPFHMDGHKWMLQPPPPAKVMEGKVPVSRSTSYASQISRRTVTTESTSLGRLVHEKTVEAKLRSGETPSELDSSTTLGRPVHKRRLTASSLGARSFQTRRSRSFSLDSSDASDDCFVPRRSRARPMFTPDFDSSEDEEYFSRNFDSYRRGRRVASRPKLQSIPSSKASEKGVLSEKTSSKGIPKPESSQPVSHPLADVSITFKASPPTEVFVINGSNDEEIRPAT